MLRRRFFTPASIGDPEVFRPHVTAAVANLAAVDEAVRKDRRNVESRFLQAYPFHPDLTDVFYTRWTQLDRFQRTRGILRTFAIALRDAERWDTAPLVGPNVFLPAPGRDGIAEAARELTGIATREATESRGQDWAAVLEGELAKARTIQDEQSGLRGRELEQAVCTVFLCSQPIGQKAHTRDLIGLVGAARPGRIELEQALRRWTELSWFLDENEFGRGGGRRGSDAAAEGVAARQPAQPEADARRRLRQPGDGRGGGGEAARRGPATKSLTHGARGPARACTCCRNGPATSRTTASSTSPSCRRRRLERRPAEPGGAALPRRDDRAGPSRACAATPSCWWRRRPTDWRSRAGAFATTWAGTTCSSSSGGSRRTPVREEMLAAWTRRPAAGCRRRSGRRGRSSSP